MKFKLGDKVYIEGHWNFPNHCRGTISSPPEFALRSVSDPAPWNGIRRIVKGRKGPIEFYWIKFDEPQIDGDGDGPYPEGEIESAYINLID